MLSIVPEAICGGCNSSYNSCALAYPFLYYASGPVILVHDLSVKTTTISLEHHKTYVNCLVLVGNYLVSGGTDKKLVIWEDFQVLKEITLTASVIHLAQGASFLVAITTDGNLHIFASDFSLVQTLNFKKNLQETAALASFNGLTYMATGGADARVHIYTTDSNTFTYQASLEGHCRNIRSLDFRPSPEFLHLASGGQDSLIRIWKFSDTVEVDSISNQGIYKIGEKYCKLDAVVTGHSNLVSSVKWIGENLLTASHDFSVVLWKEDGKMWQPKGTFGQMGGNKNIFIGALGVPGRILAYSYSGGFSHWVEEGENWIGLPAPTGHFAEITDLSVHEDFVMTCSLDQTCRMWAFTSHWAEVSRPMVHGYDINTIALSIMPLQLYAGADEKIIRAFDPSTTTAEILNKLGLYISASSRGSSQVLGLTTKSTNNIEIDLEHIEVTEDLLNSFTLWPESNKFYGHGYELNKIVLSHSGKILASACKSQTKEHSKVFLWDLITKQRVQELEFHSLGVTDLNFSNNDKFLLTVSRDRSWCLFEKNTEEVYVLKVSSQVHSRVIYSAAWALNDLVFATGSRDKKVKIWKTDGECLNTLQFACPVTAVCFVSDDIIAVGLENGEVKVFDFLRKTEVAAFKCGSSVVKIRVLLGKIYLISVDHTLRIYKVVDKN